MRITINDIARLADVSNATVSHVINNTRYVSPEIKKRVWQVIEETRYSEKLRKKNGIIRVDEGLRVALVVPDISSITYSHFCLRLAMAFEQQGFTFCTFFSFGNAYREKIILNSLISDRSVSGIVLIPVEKDGKGYDNIAGQIPLVCMDRFVDSGRIPCVLSDNRRAIFQATRHLIRTGHENIALVVDDCASSVGQESIEGYRQALETQSITFSDKRIVRIPKNANESGDSLLMGLDGDPKPTACIAATNRLTEIVLKHLRCAGKEFPRDISFIGYGDNEWSELAQPPLSNIRHDISAMVEKTVVAITGLMNETVPEERITSIPLEFTVRQSTQSICRGPFGEKAFPAEGFFLSEEEQQLLKDKHFTVAISFHDIAPGWTNLHEQTIRETLNSFGVSIIAVTDARNDCQFQMNQLDSLIMMKPDAIISLPVDEAQTAAKYKEISSKTKLIFLNSFPQGLEPEDYYGWVSVNDRENGQIAASIMIDHFKKQKDVKVGMLTHGISFRGSFQREFCVEQLFKDAENITIVDKRDFKKKEKVYDACYAMMLEHPEIQGIYVTYNSAAIEAIHALEALERDDVVVVTNDLDLTAAQYMAQRRFIIGVSAQRVYEQGVALAYVTAKALLGDTSHKNLCVQPAKVLPSNLRQAWREIMHSREPEFLN
jgi:ribose transport system substrate-binding protein